MEGLKHLKHRRMMNWMLASLYVESLPPAWPCIGTARTILCISMHYIYSALCLYISATCFTVGQISNTCNADQLLTNFNEAMQFATRNESGPLTLKESCFLQRLSILLERYETKQHVNEITQSVNTMCKGFAFPSHQTPELPFQSCLRLATGKHSLYEPGGC